MKTKEDLYKKYPGYLFYRDPDADCPNCGGEGDKVFFERLRMPCFCMVVPTNPKPLEQAIEILKVLYEGLITDLQMTDLIKEIRASHKRLRRQAE